MRHSVLRRRLEWKSFEVTVTDRKSIVVRDVINDVKESLGNCFQFFFQMHNLCCNILFIEVVSKYSFRFPRPYYQDFTGLQPSCGSDNLTVLYLQVWYFVL